jgi:hypothetical protein
MPHTMAVIHGRLSARIGGCDGVNAENAGDAAFNATNDTADRAADDSPDRSGGIVADVSTMGGAVGNALRLRGGQRRGDSGDNDDDRQKMELHATILFC